MPRPPRRQFAEDLLPLQRNYLRRLSGYVTDIRRLRELVRADFCPVYDLQHVLRLSHNLMGSGTTFGFPLISQTASEVNQAIQKFLEIGDGDPRERNRQQSGIVEKLYLFEEACTQVISTQTVGDEKSPALRLVRGEKTIYLASSVPDALDQLAQRMTVYGFMPKLLPKIDRLEGEIGGKFVHALVIYSDDPPRDLAALALPHMPKAKEAAPFIVISPADTFEARLAAVRAGAHVYLPPDAEPAEIIKMIDDIAGHEMETIERSHILLSDGDGMSANFYAHTLQMAGFEVTVAPTPVRVLDVLATRQVDLFVTGLNFPSCTGFELAAVVRQFSSLQQDVLFIADQGEFDGLAGSNINKREENFLIKPFNPSQLVALVKILVDKAQSYKTA